MGHRLVRYGLSRLFGEVDEDGGGLHSNILVFARSLVFDARSRLYKRVELLKFRRALVTRPHISGLDVVREPALLEHDEDLLHVRAGQGIKIDHRIVSPGRTAGLRLLSIDDGDGRVSDPADPT